MSLYGNLHGCGIPHVKLTDEHVPPNHVQKLVERGHAIVNPFDMIDEHKRSLRRLPPARRFRGGMKVKTLGECCQQLTQHHYGQAFYDWTQQGLELTEKLTGREDTVPFMFGKLKYWPVAVESGWLESSRIIAACPFAVFAEHVRDSIRGAVQP